MASSLPPSIRAERDLVSRFEAKKSSRVMLETALRNHLRYYDAGDSGFLDFERFCRAFEQYSYGVDVGIMKEIFDRYAEGSALNYRLFSRLLATGEAPPSTTEAFKTRQGGTYKDTSSNDNATSNQNLMQDAVTPSYPSGYNNFNNSPGPKSPGPGTKSYSYNLKNIAMSQLGRFRQYLYSLGPLAVVEFAMLMSDSQNGGLRRSDVNGRTQNQLFLHPADQTGRRILSYNDFLDCLRRWDERHSRSSNTNSSSQESFFSDDSVIETLFQTFKDPHSQNALSYDDFLDECITYSLSTVRRNLIRSAFRRLDPESQGHVNLNDMKQCFNARRHPFVVTGNYSGGSTSSEGGAQGVKNEFFQSLIRYLEFRRGPGSMMMSDSHHGNVLNTRVSWEEFEEYHRITNGCYDDNTFDCLLTRCWDLDKNQHLHSDGRGGYGYHGRSKNYHDSSYNSINTEHDHAAGFHANNRRIGLHHWQSQTLDPTVKYRHSGAKLELGGVFRSAVSHLRSKGGLTALVSFVQNLLHSDDDIDDRIDRFEFRKACKNSGIRFEPEEESDIFNQLGIRYVSGGSGSSGGGGGSDPIPGSTTSFRKKKNHGMESLIRPSGTNNDSEGDGNNSSVILLPIFPFLRVFFESATSEGRIRLIDEVWKKIVTTNSTELQVNNNNNNDSINSSDVNDINATLSNALILPSLIKKSANFNYMTHSNNSQNSEGPQSPNEFFKAFQVFLESTGGQSRDGCVSYEAFRGFMELVSASISLDAYFHVWINRVFLENNTNTSTGASGGSISSTTGPHDMSNINNINNRQPKSGNEHRHNLLFRENQNPNGGKDSVGNVIQNVLSPGNNNRYGLDGKAEERERGMRTDWVGAPDDKFQQPYLVPMEEFELKLFTDALTNLKRNLGRRGMKAWVHFLQSIRDRDIKRNGGIHKGQFMKVIKSLGLGLNDQEIDVIFKRLPLESDPANGGIDYQLLISEIKKSNTESSGNSNANCGSAMSVLQQFKDSGNQIFEECSDELEGQRYIFVEKLLKERFDPRSYPLTVMRGRPLSESLQDFETAVSLLQSYLVESDGQRVPILSHKNWMNLYELGLVTFYQKDESQLFGKGSFRLQM